MPALTITPRKNLDAALAVLTEASTAFDAAAARIAAYEAAPATREDGTVLGLPLRFRIRLTTTERALKAAAVAYRAAQVDYARAYPVQAKRLFGVTA